MHKQNAQKSVGFVVKMDKNIVKTNKNEPFRPKNGGGILTKCGNKAIIYSCIKGVRGNRKHTLKNKKS